MGYIVSVLCLCAVFAIGDSAEIQPIVQAVDNIKNTTSPLEFPKKTDVSTPILVGDDPKSGNLPPKKFPSNFTGPSGPSIITGSDLNITEINHRIGGTELNEKVTDILKNVTNQEVSKGTLEKAKTEETLEQEDMLHSKYKGGKDVDEILKPEKKASEDEKKPVTPKKDPKSEVSVSSSLDKNGPKLMNETRTKSGESMLESTSKMMAVSSSVLANSHSKQQHGIIEPTKTVATVLLTGVAILCLGAIGFLVWKKIAMRRFGRDVLINEEDFDEVADMHTFDRAQIQIT